MTAKIKACRSVCPFGLALLLALSAPTDVLGQAQQGAQVSTAGSRGQMKVLPVKVSPAIVAPVNEVNLADGLIEDVDPLRLEFDEPKTVVSVNSEPKEAASGRSFEKPIKNIQVSLAADSGPFPKDLSVSVAEYHADRDLRPWNIQVYNWEAPNICHLPLYFEEINVERMGYSRLPCLQPAISGLHFVGGALAMPYAMAVRPPCVAVYPLGKPRAGSREAFRRNYPEMSIAGSAAETGAIAGLILLIP